MDQSTETLDAIREINLSYIVLAQQMLRDDRAVGMFRLGLSSSLADLLAGLSLAQAVRLASSDHILCVFRVSDYTMLSAMTQPVKHPEISPTHAALLLAGQSAAQFE
ncbi:flagellar transcriptional regulator FlhD [Paraburkholderia phenazinium]|uniref:flagellar transcriptional regulator FlhD n=1 Tax=Paraburkholderia phenazinium TaxID=60549 RepID=UPI00158C62ED|nr:flagellar transcriptional regulator FlhD [Paraburkholderia phenazinium]